MSTYRSLREAPLDGKKVLLRAGFDVPIEDGRVIDDTRIRAVVPTVRALLDGGAAVIILAHQDRPKGAVVPSMSQRPLVPLLSALLGENVLFADCCVGGDARAKVDALTPGQVLLLENLRFDAREEENDAGFAAELASYGDLYVNDAFANCHRAHASMDALARALPAYMGVQLEREIDYLSGVLTDPARPLTLVISGAKIETKVPVIERFLDAGDHVLVGGAIANTFIAAAGHGVGTSLVESAMIPTARRLMDAAGVDGRAVLHVPLDAVTAPSRDDAARAADRSLDAIGDGEAVLDLGPRTVESYLEVIRASATIVWNGPLGVTSVPRFARASIATARALQEAAARGATVIIGGGDTLEFLAREGFDFSTFTFVSTGGGAMLDFLSGAPLPALEALAART